MCPSGRNRSRTVIVVDESSKSPLLDCGGQSVDDNKQVGGDRVAIEEPCEKLENNNVIVENFDEKRQIPRGSGDHLENGGKITFCFNKVKNRPMWQ
jgi:hypothetical protein